MSSQTQPKDLNLYAYFGLLGLHDIDIPGHSLYQIPLLQSIDESYHDNQAKFHFYSYLPSDVLDGGKIHPYPGSDLATWYENLQLLLISDYITSVEILLENIKNRIYSKLYLKARFRNLSTLAKGWSDAYIFEKILDVALSAGYSPADIVILDTDLSLPYSFINKISDCCITRLIPSIDFPVISSHPLDMMLSLQSNSNKYTGTSSDFSAYYYGNLVFTNYKAGHEKNNIIFDVFNELQFAFGQDDEGKFVGIPRFPLALIGKVPSTLSANHTFNHIRRDDRCAIWNVLSAAYVSINVSKDIYLEEGFIPARVHEAILFGNIPVSYSPNGEYEWLHPALCFKTPFEFLNIIKFLSTQTPQELFAIYKTVVENYKKYNDLKFAATALREVSKENNK